MKNIAFILLILAAVCFANCAGDYEAEPRGTNDGKAPAPITNISVKNVNGGLLLNILLPMMSIYYTSKLSSLIPAENSRK